MGYPEMNFGLNENSNGFFTLIPVVRGIRFLSIVRFVNILCADLFSFFISVFISIFALWINFFYDGLVPFFYELE